MRIQLQVQFTSTASVSVLDFEAKSKTDSSQLHLDRYPQVICKSSEDASSYLFSDLRKRRIDTFLKSKHTSRAVQPHNVFAKLENKFPVPIGTRFHCVQVF